MMECNLKVNGITIGHLYLHNTGSVVASGWDKDTFKEEYMYYWEYFQPGKKEGKCLFKGSVAHNRDDGAEELVQKILACVVKEQNKDSKRV